MRFAKVKVQSQEVKLSGFILYDTHHKSPRPFRDNRGSISHLSISYKDRRNLQRGQHLLRYTWSMTNACNRYTIKPCTFLGKFPNKSYDDFATWTYIFSRITPVREYDKVGIEPGGTGTIATIHKFAMITVQMFRLLGSFGFFQCALVKWLKTLTTTKRNEGTVLGTPTFGTIATRGTKEDKRF